MRRITSFSQRNLAAASAPQCIRMRATLPVASRRALSTPTTEQTPRRIRKALWKDGDAPGPVDPFDPEASQALRQERMERDFAAAAAQAESAAQKALKSARKPRKPRSRLKTTVWRTTAPTEETAESMGYVPATHMDGLEEIGGFDGWWDQPGRWGDESQYVGWSARNIAEKIADGNICEALVRQAFVETLALLQLDRGALTGKFFPGNREDFERAMKINLKAFEIKGTVYEDQQGIMGKIAKMMQRFDRKHTETGDIISADEAKVLVESWDSKWKALPIQDPLAKFALNKRVFQLTGHRVHDAKLVQINTVGQFVETIRKPPKPAKVAEAIVEEGSLLELPNVKVSPRRVTPIDKEIALGRWKVIQKELERRNLPVTGHKHLSGLEQWSWIQGTK